MPTGTAARSSPWIQTKEAQMPVYSATRDDEIDRCFPVISQLRPHLERAHFVEQVRRQQQRGYHLAYVEEDRKVHTAAGFRIEENLAHGLHLYVDDLVTDSETRSRIWHPYAQLARRTCTPKRLRNTRSRFRRAAQSRAPFLFGSGYEDFQLSLRQGIALKRANTGTTRARTRMTRCKTYQGPCRYAS